jgi:hypothetical protein
MSEASSPVIPRKLRMVGEYWVMALAPDHYEVQMESVHELEKLEERKRLP